MIVRDRTKPVRRSKRGRCIGAPAAILALSLGLAGGIPAGADAQATIDLCGCIDHPDSLGAFDPKDQTTWPPGTTIERNVMEIPLPPNGVLVFSAFKGVKWMSGTNYIVFKRNAANTPVTILVAGDFSIEPYVDIHLIGRDGENGRREINGRGGRPAPGGFRGGDGAYLDVNGAKIGGEGLGPLGGAPGGGEPLENGGEGKFGGRDDLLPMIGGSGGGGGGSAATGNCSASGGGGGGGALLLAVNGKVSIGGAIFADGGRPGGYRSNKECSSFGGGGSGGAIRMIAREVVGTGYLRARGRRGDRGGMPGVIRIESLTEDQLNPDRVAPPAIRTGVIGPLINPIPATVRVTSIGGQAMPEVVSGTEGGVDVVLPAPGEVAVEVQTTGVPAGTMVEVALKPRAGEGGRRDSAELAPSSCTPEGLCKAFITFDLPSGAYFVEAVATFRTP